MEETPPTSAKNELCLYHHHHSFYSQKVWMALLEKNVPFSEYLIDAANSKQYRPWFLNMNPRGEVPVLKDGRHIILDSRNIIDYLEDNYSDEPYKRLEPMGLNQETIAHIEEIRRKIDAIDGNVFSCGVAFHPELAGEKLYPFSLSIVNRNLKVGVTKLRETVLTAADDNPMHSQALHRKANELNAYQKQVSDKAWMERELLALTVFLESVEKQLMYRQPGMENWWLCCEYFTKADISLTILLYRLSRIGLKEKTFGPLPHLNGYFERACERSSFKSMTGSLPWKDVLMMLQNNKPVIIFSSVLLFVLVILVIVFWH